MTQRGYREPIAERLDRWTDKSGGPDACWPWTGGHTKAGYGIITINGRSMTAHRVAYQQVYGPVAAGLYVCHRCDNPPCMNTKHLFVGPAKANTEDMVSKGRARGGARNPLRGEQVRQAKLTAAQVVDLRHRRAEGLSYEELAQEFGVAYSTVERICHSRDWKHIEGIDAERARNAAHERRRRASQHNNSRLTPGAVREIRDHPGVPLRTLAQQLGVSAQTVANVRSGKSWREVD